MDLESVTKPASFTEDCKERGEDAYGCSAQEEDNQEW
jgi:hypothetical protein